MNNIIVDDKAGVRYYFTITDGVFVCKCGDNTITLAEGCTDADCCTDDTGGIYAVAVCQSTIECCYNNGGGWHRYTAVASGNGNCNVTAIKTVCISGRLNLWYSLDCGDRKMLIHQISDGEDMTGDPYAVGNLGYKKKFDICCDYDKNTHIFFVDEDDRLYHMSYIWSEKKYTPKEYIAGRISHVSAAADKSGRVYIAAVGKKAEFNVIYFKELQEEECRILGFGVDTGCTVDVVDCGDRLYVQWMDNRECCECSGTDRGASFSRPVSVNSMRGGANRRIAYRNCANPLKMGVNVCMCNYGLKMLHEKEIVACAGKFVTMDEEMNDYVEKSAEGMKFGADMVLRLAELEKQVAAIAEYLQKAEDGETDNTDGGLSDE